MSELIKLNLAETLFTLGEKLLNPSEELMQLINRERNYNAWFTPENVLQSVQAIGKMLNADDLKQWLPENAGTVFTGKKVGLVLAGNIPLVGFHDVLCTLVSGHFALIKASANDSRLISYILNQLVLLEPEFANRYEFTERLAGFDAVMATGSNNTSRYFEYYFGKVPNIIRKNRNSLAVLSGEETEAELQKLGHDIFDYFGLG
ncbi:MAG: acyl-CoA reductase, partial [Sphingobacteriaceae bacterium]